MTSRASFWLRHVWLPLAWGVGLVLILWGRVGPSDPAAQQYGANWPGDLRAALALLTVETLVLYAILRPWSYRASWQRSLLALLVVAPWALLSVIVTMHAGRILGLLAFWRLLLIPALAITVGVSANGAWRSRRVAAT
jgi:hypothetical protein